MVVHHYPIRSRSIRKTSQPAQPLPWSPPCQRWRPRTEHPRKINLDMEAYQGVVALPGGPHFAYGWARRTSRRRVRPGSRNAWQAHARQRFSDSIEGPARRRSPSTAGCARRRRTRAACAGRRGSNTYDHRPPRHRAAYHKAEVARSPWRLTSMTVDDPASKINAVQIGRLSRSAW